MSKLEIASVNREYLKNTIQIIKQQAGERYHWGGNELYNVVKDFIAGELGIPFRGMGRIAEGKFMAYIPDAEDARTVTLERILKENSDLFK